MNSIRVRNTAWHYEEAGSGPALVLVHGFPLDRRIWDEQVKGLSDRFRVIAVDLKGFGKSVSTETFTIDSMADELAEFLGAVKAAPCVLAAISMGGYVAFSLAVRHPEVIKGLAIVCSKAEADTLAGKEGRQKVAELAQTRGAKPVADIFMPKVFCEDTYRNREDMVRKLREIMEACPPTTIANACYAMRDRADRIPDLPNLRMPVLIALGEKDSLIPTEMGKVMAMSCRQGSLKLIADAGHMAPMEQPAEVNRMLAEFASRV